jgi:hypothetical protein
MRVFVFEGANILEFIILIAYATIFNHKLFDVFIINWNKVYRGFIDVIALKGFLIFLNYFYHFKP